MKVAIVGSSGYIAGYLLQAFSHESKIESVIKIDQKTGANYYLDLLKAEQFDYSSLQGIDFIIFTAAVSGPDQCASEYESCWKINVEGTEYFIKKALQNHCRVLFFSSDAVFGDIPGEIYYEDSQTKANTSYGIMKKHVEDTFKSETNFKAIRLSYVVSSEDRFMNYCKSCIKENVVAEIFHPFYRNCIVVDEVVETVFWFLEHWDSYKPFVFNVAGKELVSRLRIADELNRCFNNQLKYKVIMPSPGFFQNRPAITQMQSKYRSIYHIIDDLSFTERIQRELKKENMKHE